jgi:cell filamentation protein, protein adenylyltransferase
MTPIGLFPTFTGTPMNDMFSFFMSPRAPVRLRNSGSFFTSGMIKTLSLRLIKEIHGVLMHGVRGGKKMPGEFRKSQNWIGPAGSTLRDATFAPPPPNEAAEAMGELEKYMHTKSGLPVLIDCALIHFQFETIHPFLDGNGRLGRLVITFHLYWRGVLHRPLLYLSFFFKRHRRKRWPGLFRQQAGFF